MNSQTLEPRPLAPAAPLPAAPKTSLGTLLLWAVVLAMLAGSWKGADLRPLDLLSDSGNMAEYLKGFLLEAR